MTERMGRLSAWSTFAACVVMFMASVGFDLATKLAPGQASQTDVFFGALMMVFPIIGILILSKHPTNHIGWIMMLIGIGWTLGVVGSYGRFALSRGLPFGIEAIGLSAPTWAPPVILLGTSLLLRFPNGTLLSARWQWVERIALTALGGIVALILLTPGDLTDEGFPKLQNPFGIEGARWLFNVLGPLLLLVPISVGASAASLVMRFRRSTGVERVQMKWLVTAASFLAVTFGAAMVASLGTSWGTASTPGWVEAVQRIATTSFVLIPIAVGIAILKHRLYDIDVVISKTLVYTALAAFVTATYVAVVVGAGSLLRARNDLLLSVTATVVVAFAFQPVHRRAQHIANRWVYGERATPYEVLANLSESIAHSGEPTDVLQNMLATFARATGAARAAVLSGTIPLAAFPVGDTATDYDHRFPIADRGEELGTLALSKPANEPLRDEEADLARYLAGQAGLLLRNHRLNLGLLTDLEALRVSRQRLVRAQDEERMRLEQELRASTQPVLAAAQETAARLASVAESEQVRDLLVGVGTAAADAMTTVLDLARGLYPATLEAEGVGPALRAQAARATVPLHVEDDGQRFPREGEAALYFCALEAIQNAMKYAQATRITARVWHEGDRAHLSVRDDGIGFAVADVAAGSGTGNMADRLGAIGGTLSIASAPGEGTSVTGSVPLRSIHRGSE